jgi:hypothetical protein
VRSLASRRSSSRWRIVIPRICLIIGRLFSRQETCQITSLLLSLAAFSLTAARLPVYRLIGKCCAGRNPPLVAILLEHLALSLEIPIFLPRFFSSYNEKSTPCLDSDLVVLLYHKKWFHSLFRLRR